MMPDETIENGTLSFAFETLGGHVHVTVRAGTVPGQRALAGRLVLSPSEADELRALVRRGARV